MAKFPKWINVKSVDVEDNKTIIVFRIRWWHPLAWAALWKHIVKIASEAGYPAYHPKVIWEFVKLLVQVNLVSDK